MIKTKSVVIFLLTSVLLFFIFMFSSKRSELKRESYLLTTCFRISAEVVRYKKINKVAPTSLDDLRGAGEWVDVWKKLNQNAHREMSGDLNLLFKVSISPSDNIYYGVCREGQVLKFEVLK